MLLAAGYSWLENLTSLSEGDESRFCLSTNSLLRQLRHVVDLIVIVTNYEALVVVGCSDAYKKNQDAWDGGLQDTKLAI